MKSKLTRLEKLYEKRNKQYQETTTVLLDLLAPVFQAATLVMERDNTDEITPMDVNWRDIDIYNGHATIVGLMTYPLGTEVILQSGERVFVDEEIQTALSQIIRIGIPVEMAERGNVSEIMAYIDKHRHNSNDLNELVNPEELVFNDFDTENLTDEQIQQIAVFESQHKGKIN